MSEGPWNGLPRKPAKVCAIAAVVVAAVQAHSKIDSG